MLQTEKVEQTKSRVGRKKEFNRVDVRKEEQNTAGKSTKSVVSKTNLEDPLAKLQISELREGVHSHRLCGGKIDK